MCNKYLLMEGDISEWKEVKLDNIKDFIRNQIDIEPDFVKIVNDNFWDFCDFKDFNQNMELEGVTEEDYSNYLKTVISEEEYQEIMIDLSKDNFISKCNSNDDFISKCNSNELKLLSDFKKPLYHTCEKCGNPMYANMKFGVVELECQTCGNYREI